VEFLGTQGDPWDTQSDMFSALLGALVALVLLARMQDRQIRAVEGIASNVFVTIYDPQTPRTPCLGAGRV